MHFGSLELRALTLIWENMDGRQLGRIFGHSVVFPFSVSTKIAAHPCDTLHLLILGLTKDVDLTITNILEGKVQYKSEEPGVEADKTVETTTLDQSALKSTSVC